MELDKKPKKPEKLIILEELEEIKRMIQEIIKQLEDMTTCWTISGRGGGLKRRARQRGRKGKLRKGWREDWSRRRGFEG